MYIVLGYFYVFMLLLLFYNETLLSISSYLKILLFHE